MTSLGTWIVGAVVMAIIGLAAGSVYKSRKNGTGCGCSCDGCSKCPGSMK